MLSEKSKSLNLTRLSLIIFSIILFLIALQIYSIKSSSQVASYYEKDPSLSKRSRSEKVQSEDVAEILSDDDDNQEDEGDEEKEEKEPAKTDPKKEIGSNKTEEKIDSKIPSKPERSSAKQQEFKKGNNCARWIVITSVNDPTDHVKYIQDALIDWCLVVVGDSKSPSNWAYKDAVFLSIKDQTELLSKRYKLVAQIPTKSYLRKVIGYLYAIDHGAKYIYETDDDNSALDGLLGFKYTEMRGLEMACEPATRFINPYAYFGQPSMWPRGYPLEMISENALDFNCTKFRISNDVPLIQQGLVNGDPDVDAIYRLTRKQSTKLLYVEFDSKAPSLVLNKRQYAPINSQNTFFHYASFWSLVFPRNVTFREVDILRGYIAIRLFQEIDGRVGFFAPNAVQIRNAHSYHKDYLEEKRLYESILRFVEDLDQWVCEKKKMMKTSIKDCFVQCIQMLIKKKHLSESEMEFYQIWISDLDNMSYKWPEIRTWTPLRDAKLAPTVHFRAVEQDHSSNSNNNEKSIVQTRTQETKKRAILKMCQLSNDKKIELERTSRIDDVILVTWVKSREQIELISNVINIHFKFIVACYASTSKIDVRTNEFIMSNTSGGIALIDSVANFKQCVYTATNMGYKLNSFIFAKELHLFEFWNDNITLEDSKETLNLYDYDTNNKQDEELLNKNVYFVRKTVANGQRVLKTSSSTNFNITSYCSIYSSSNNEYTTIVKKLKTSLKSLSWHSNDLVSESCSRIDSRTIWIADPPNAAAGPSRLDVFATLLRLGQNPRLVGLEDKPPYVSSHMSDFVKNFTFMSKLDEESVKGNFKYYKESSDFKNVDAVICLSSSALCEAFILLNKTIIFNPAHRYNLGRCTKESWYKLNENYRKLKSKSKLIVAAMSRYDEEYQAHFTGLRGYKLYSHNTFEATTKRTTAKNEILVDAKNDTTSESWLNEMRKLGESKNLVFKTRGDVINTTTVSAVVVIPYLTTAYSPLILDYYRSNVPIFVPSVQMLLKYKSSISRTVFPECGGQFAPAKPDSYSKHLDFDPNSDKDDDFKYWMKYTDYYQLPFITVFNSWPDLIEKLQSADMNRISHSMCEFNRVRQAYAIDNWCRLIKSLPKHQQSIPDSFDEALSYFSIRNVQSY